MGAGPDQEILPLPPSPPNATFSSRLARPAQRPLAPCVPPPAGAASARPPVAGLDAQPPGAVCWRWSRAWPKVGGGILGPWSAAGLAALESGVPPPLGAVVRVVAVRNLTPTEVHRLGAVEGAAVGEADRGSAHADLEVGEIILHWT